MHCYLVAGPVDTTGANHIRNLSNWIVVYVCVVGLKERTQHLINSCRPMSMSVWRSKRLFFVLAILPSSKIKSDGGCGSRLIVARTPSWIQWDPPPPSNCKSPVMPLWHCGGSGGLWSLAGWCTAPKPNTNGRWSIVSSFAWQSAWWEELGGPCYLCELPH